MAAKRRALLVGIDDYDDPDFGDLRNCVDDVVAMADMLGRNADGSLNFDCRVLSSSDPQPVSRAALRRAWRDLFADARGSELLFYYSGHGSPGDVGGFLVTQDGVDDDPGLPMNDVVDMANASGAESVLIILDCCYSGAAGNVAATLGSLESGTDLREGVTVLAASRATQAALEVGGHGVFTRLVLGALAGGAADVRGRISAASIYGYVEAALGAWGQRPIYKSHAVELAPVRMSDARVPDILLRELTGFFAEPDDEYALDPTYEETEKDVAVPAHVAVFKKFKSYQVGGLLCPVHGLDLYWAAKRSQSVRLTELGKFYHELVSTSRI